MDNQAKDLKLMLKKKKCQHRAKKCKKKRKQALEENGI